jgi:uncharacterized protein (DUF885 family)
MPRSIPRATAALAAALHLLSCAGAAGAKAPPPGAAGAAGATGAAQDSAEALADAFVRAHFARHPELATVFTWPGADHGALTDPTPEARRAWEREEDRFLDRARALPPGEPGTSAWLARGIMVDALEASVATRACRQELWSVSSFSGWQSRAGQLAALQPVGTPALRDAAVRRLEAVPRYVDGELANLRTGLAAGYSATRENVERALAELDALTAVAPADSALLAPARRDPDPAFRARLEAAVRDAVLPAARRYRDFLRAEYLQRARTGQGVSSLPGGEACYRAALRRFTTLPLAPREVHELGLARIAELRGQMEAVARRSFATSDVERLLHDLRQDPRYTYRTSEEILERTRAAIARAQEAAPRWFGRVPRAPVRVEPYPAFQERSSPVERYSPSKVGGKLEGVYFINVFHPAQKSRAMTESTAFHETIPGHHFQLARALEAEDVPPIARYLFNSAYVEGWGLYAERLADEMGVFSGDLDRLGLLSSESFRAARLVIDSGLHAFGWSRQQAIDYLLAHTALEEAQAASEVDRYTAAPGQATAYMVGAIEIRKLRASAAEALGAAFDVRGFHDAVLDGGAVPLPMLRERVAGFVARRRQAAREAQVTAPARRSS